MRPKNQYHYSLSGAPRAGKYEGIDQPEASSLSGSAMAVRLTIKPLPPAKGVSLMRTMTKKNKVLAAAGALALVAGGGGAAYAYWTTTGSGNGTAANSAGGGTITLHATFDAGLAPGNSVPVAYTADNGTTSSTKVGALSASVTTSDAGCLPAWFDVTAETSNTTVAANTTGTSVGAGTLTFNDSATVDQGACKGAVVTITVGSV